MQAKKTVTLRGEQLAHVGKKIPRGSIYMPVAGGPVALRRRRFQTRCERGVAFENDCEQGRSVEILHRN